MAERIIELLYRNLQEVFGEGDAARRRAAIADFYTEDCVLYVPPGAHVGHDALDKFAGELRCTSENQDQNIDFASAMAAAEFHDARFRLCRAGRR
jgi:ketosteroid isomerase-like protein